MGRRSTYSTTIAASICERLSVGQSLREICRDEKMPAASTVFKWLAERKEFSEQYARAKEAGIEALAEDILDIADDATNDWMERLGDEEQPIGFQLNGEHIQRSKLRIDARKWLLSKLSPKKYGDKVQQELSGPDGGPVQVEETNRPKISKEEWLKAHGVGTSAGTTE